MPERYHIGMKIKESGVALSHIVEIGENLAALSARTGAEYLRLNRGINSVVNIDLREVIAGIDFNTAQMQTYPPGRGFAALRDAINAEYFGGESSRDNLLIVPGAMNGLDLLAQSVDIERLYLPVYYWGCYFKLLTIRGVQRAEYPSLDRLESMIPRLTGCGVLICDPGNPLGQKYDDARLLALLRKLDAAGVPVFFDSPYRRVFRDATDTFYREIRPLRNVAIVESFSKSMGLSGQRIGFIHTTDPGLYAELEKRTMYTNNGVNAFAQTLVLRLLTTPEGRRAVADFKAATVRDIGLNIAYLKENGLLATEFYRESMPVGIFAIVDRSEKELLEHRIGSVSLDFFTRDAALAGYASRFSRICVSVPHTKFREFFDPLVRR